jgi:UDPglucose 6-dehydrogenase
MNIGIIGVGVVGSAVKFGFERLGHDVSAHDIALGTSIEDVLETEVCYICVPTPSDDDGSCDVSIVESVLDQLLEHNYKGVACIKSTVIPGTTERLKKKFAALAFVPEFLRERCAVHDFINDHEVCIIGTDNISHFEAIKKSHGRYPKEFVQCTPTEAEFAKYYHNVYNAMQITFANSFYEICKEMGVDYNKMKDALKNRSNINFQYLECNKNFRGFGGVCLPKDTRAMDYLAKKLGLNVKFFDHILTENEKYGVTVPNGMRL